MLASLNSFRLHPDSTSSRLHLAEVDRSPIRTADWNENPSGNDDGLSPLRRLGAGMEGLRNRSRCASITTRIDHKFDCSTNLRRSRCGRSERRNVNRAGASGATTCHPRSLDSSQSLQPSYFVSSRGSWRATLRTFFDLRQIVTSRKCLRLCCFVRWPRGGTCQSAGVNLGPHTTLSRCDRCLIR